MRVAIGVKAFNEADNIATTLNSALEAVAPFGGDVILADCLSTDATITIAYTFPAVQIYQLTNAADRSCGAGAQLAYQHARCDFFYLLDGDMVLDSGFISAGVDFLTRNPKYAGVGGRVQEANLDSVEFELRARNNAINGSAITGDVDRLDCGGLYRCEALREVGYFADRNLRAFEEFDLGARLRCRGWRLARISAPAVLHRGHRMGGYRLMLKRIRSGYADAPGQVIRASICQRHFLHVALKFRQLHYAMAVAAWWFLLFEMFLADKYVLLTIFAMLPVLFLTYRRRSLRLGVYSMATWNVNAYGLIRGVCRRRILPTTPIPSLRLR